MSNLPEKRAFEEENLVSPWEKKWLFDSIYKGNPSFDLEDDLFQKDSRKLLLENTPFTSYQIELKFKEFELARSIFILRAGKHLFDEFTLHKVCEGLGPLLFHFMNEKLSDDQKVEITRKIKELLGKDDFTCKKLLYVINLSNVNDQNTLIPLKPNLQPHSPCTMTGTIQANAAGENRNFIFPFPVEIPAHFPVFFCHSVFAEFMGILHNRNGDGVVIGEYKKFMESNLNNIRTKVDDCISDLIIAMLSDGFGQKESDLVKKVVSGLQNLFPPLQVDSNARISGRSGDTSNNIKMDAVVAIGNFPFIIIEAKNNAYSIRAVLQGLQYYGLLETEFIDNDPCFLITLDRGIFYLYGVAKVNRRVVCSCLVALEFTSYHFNIEGFSDTLYRCISALYFFYERFSARIPDKPPIHNIKNILKLNLLPAQKINHFLQFSVFNQKMIQMNASK